ncbi:MAG: hypothetical protein M3020_17140 [Myxococcota bacterium]|nr:hypothetical protein [Myxococcota bacterium]
MTTTKKLKKKAAAAAEKRERKERRFAAEETYASRVAIGAGMLGSLALGGGVYATWIRDQSASYGGYLVAAGALVLGGALYRTGADPGTLRVGDAGVAYERSNELTRVLWCDIEKLSLDGDRVNVKGKSGSLSFPRAAFPKGLALLAAEAGKRVPDVVKLSRTEIEALGSPKDSNGELVPIEEIQVTGRHCKATDKPISFERDARLCPNCCEVYLKDQVPKKCLTCGQELGTRATPA